MSGNPSLPSRFTRTLTPAEHLLARIAVSDLERAMQEANAIKEARLGAIMKSHDVPEGVRADFDLQRGTISWESQS